MLIEYHRTMLADRPRNDAFYRALKSVIRKGETVIADIGAGTGLLGFMAEKLGARAVFLFENGPIVDVALKLAKANKMKTCSFFHGHSTEAVDVPMVDVLVSETLGNYGFEENIIETMNDAKRFLNPGGVVIPQSLAHAACPVIDGRFFEELGVWDDVGYGLDYTIARKMSLNNAYVRSFVAADLLDGGKAAQVWDSVDFRKKNSSTRRGRLEWKVKKSATIYGVALWWNCTLVPGVDLSTAPSAPKTHWEQLYFPVLEPIEVKKGDLFVAELSSHSSYEGGTDLNWRFIHNGGAAQVMGLRKGYLG
jgi:protein arginine N-methyltransferase 1